MTSSDEALTPMAMVRIFGAITYSTKKEKKREEKGKTKR